MVVLYEIFNLFEYEILKKYLCIFFYIIFRFFKFLLYLLFDMYCVGSDIFFMFGIVYGIWKWYI